MCIHMDRIDWMLFYKCLFARLDKFKEEKNGIGNLCALRIFYMRMTATEYEHIYFVVRDELRSTIFFSRFLSSLLSILKSMCFVWFSH